MKRKISRLIRPLYLLLMGTPLAVFFTFSRFTLDLADGILFNLIKVMLNSLTYAAFTTITSLTIAMAFAFTITRIFCNSTKVKLYATSLFLLPFLLGDSSTSFMFFNSLQLFNFFEGTTSSELNNVVLISSKFTIWQLSLLATYIFVISSFEKNKNLDNYTKIHSLSDSLIFKDIFYPTIKPIISILFILFFAISFYDFLKAYIAFKPSPGLNNELVSHYLLRLYKSSFMVSVDNSFEKIMTVTALILIFSISACVLFLNFFYISLNLALKSYLKINFRKSDSAKYLYTLIMIFGCVFFIAPFYTLALNFTYIGNFEYSDLFKALLLPILISIILAILAFTIASLLRLYWQNCTQKFGKKLILLLGFTMLSTFIPPLSLSIFSINFFTGEFWQNSAYIGWNVAMFFKFLPVLTAFLICSFLTVKKAEIEYTEVHKISLMQKLLLLFVKRYFLLLIITFFLSVSLVMNETTINNVFSDHVFSLSGLFDRSLIGRSENQSTAATLQIFSCFLALSIVVLWNLFLITLFEKGSNEYRN